MARRWWALGALVASMLVLAFDLTILNVALPTMAARLDATTGQQQWMADAYIVACAALMLPAGLLGDRFGRRRTLVAGLTVFLAGSVLGALADTVQLVIGARTLMGIGAALVMPLALAVLPSVFDTDERPKAVATLTAAAAAGLPLGPIVGGWMLDHFWWGSIFALNIPMVVIGIAACVFLLPESRDPAAPEVDAASTAMSAVGLAALIFGIIEVPVRGWGDPLVVVAFAAAAVLLTALVLRERTSARPMLDMGLLGDRRFLLNALTATLGMFTLAGLMFILPPYLQAVLGNDALDTGLRMLPLMGGLMVAAKLSGPVVRRFGPRPVISAGLIVLAFATILGSRTSVDSDYTFTALWLSVAGLGFGFTVVPAMDTALAVLPVDRAGSGSGLLLTVRQVGSAVGIALLGSLLAAVYAGRLDNSGLPAAAADTAGDSVVAAHLIADRIGDEGLTAAANSAFVQGMSTALLVSGVAALVAALLVAALLPNRPVHAAPGTGKETRDGAGTDVVGGAPADARQ
ncbi:MFS transporter [Streptomyces camponoticapitis]|uniref:MFS transporter n=1 Tax=Streptomyces camponoticapitis TaxID=1616125 RepID=A0ABQ2EKH8_9ACTN|nr:MFS transporter [Streptomyces camponoticapitis]GGK15513.1 MFS transporter [Streptomyces camponoticapitis]